MSSTSGPGTGLTLAQVLSSRANNLNLLRLVAASMVLFSHSFALVSGSAAAEPWRGRVGMSPGAVAVDIFFIVSGMLVTASILRTRSAREFAAARFFRIVPGLAVALVLTVGVIGSAYYGNPLELLRRTDALWYVARNSLPVFAVVKEISGGVIFAHNPFAAEFNGSLWTLPLEIDMYALLLLLWGLGRLRPGSLRLFYGLIAAVLLFAAAKHLRFQVHGPLDFSTFRLPFMFFTGCAAAIGARWVRLHWWGLAGVAVAIGVATFDEALFYFVYSLGLWYLVLCLAYLPGGAIRAYNRAGDYSYGIYIYAWPVQQSLVAAFPGISIPVHLAASAAITGVLAIASWHWVEEPGLRLRRLVRAAPRLGAAGP